MSGNVCDHCEEWGCIGHGGFCWNCSKWNEDDEDEGDEVESCPAHVRRAESPPAPILTRLKSLQPWQHVVKWPALRVIVDIHMILLAAPHELSARRKLYEKYNVIKKQPELDGYLCEVIGSEVTVIVTSHHDSGDEDPRNP